MCGCLCAYGLLPTCVSLCVAAERPLGGPVTPVFSPVSMPGSPLLLRHTLHVVVVSFVSVTPAGPAVAQRRGRALHGTAVIYGLGGRERDRRGRGGKREWEMQRDVISFDYPDSFACDLWVKRHSVCVCLSVNGICFLNNESPPFPPTSLPKSYTPTLVIRNNNHATSKIQIIRKGSAKRGQTRSCITINFPL